MFTKRCYRWPPVTSSGGFSVGSEFNKRLTASIEKGKIEKERERERKEIF